MFGEQFQQAGVWGSAIQNDHGPYPTVNRRKGCFGLGDHAARNHTIAG